MTSKERVHLALRRRPTDRVPIFMWYHPDTARRLARRLEIPIARLPEALGDDIRQTWVNNNYAMEGIVHERDGESHTDDWGITWTRQGGFNQISRYPLADATPDQIRAYQFPVNRLDNLLNLMQPVLAYRQDYFIGCDISPCLFEIYWRLRGMENALLDLAADRPLAESLLDRATDFTVRLTEAVCDRFALDWLWTGDDVASQQALLISPDCWRDLIKPRLARIVAVGKRHGLWIAYHSCGAVRPIIPDLIEMGVDVLNPVQCNCPGMDPLELKREFGDRLAFMGGVDTQGVLPRGSADDVRRCTARLLAGMTAGGGGYILAASHTIPPETPLENIFAMYAAAGLSREAIMDRAAHVRSIYAGS